MADGVAIKGREYEEIRELVRHGDMERCAAYTELYEPGIMPGVPFTVGIMAVMPGHTARMRLVAGEEFDGGRAWEVSFHRALSITPDGLEFFPGPTGLVEAVRALRVIIEKYGY